MLNHVIASYTECMQQKALYVRTTIGSLLGDAIGWGTAFLITYLLTQPPRSLSERLNLLPLILLLFWILPPICAAIGCHLALRGAVARKETVIYVGLLLGATTFLLFGLILTPFVPVFGRQLALEKYRRKNVQPPKTESPSQNLPSR